MSEFASEKSEMLSEASVLVRRVAGPGGVGDSVKSAIRRAAHRLGFSHNRTKSIWYRDARRIDAHEIDRLRTEAARAEARAAINNLLALRRSLASADADFHCPTIAALDDALRSIGAEICPVVIPEDE